MSDEDGNAPSVSDASGSEAHSRTTEVRVQFEDVGGRTRVVLTHIGVAGDSAGAVGWTMALRKLATYLEEHQGR